MRAAPDSGVPAPSRQGPHTGFAEGRARPYHVVRQSHPEEQTMAAATRKNQDRIIANERRILRNQARLVQILDNQDRILRDLEAMLKNQKKILANQSRILAK
jgi:hypothetical protein